MFVLCIGFDDHVLVDFHTMTNKAYECVTGAQTEVATFYQL